MSDTTYKLPETLTADISKFGKLAQGYQGGTVNGVEFKAFRVPMGVYEQRKNEVYMARIRATGGVITPNQLLQVIDIAKRHGSNLLHITTRAEIQILNLELDEVESVLSELEAAGLATKGGGGNTLRNILVSEFSGISQTETFDTTPYAMAVTDVLVPEADSFLMPRKMKIAFSSDEKFEDYAGINDIGFVAKIKDGKRGFKVYIGGGAGSKPTVGWLYKEFIPAEDLYALIKAMKTFFNTHGNRKNKHQARIRYIFYKNGEEETFKLIDEFFEKEKATGKKLDVKLGDFPHSSDNDRTVVIPFVWGNISLDNDEKVEQLKAVLNFVAKISKHTVRFTTRQNIRLRNIPSEKLAELEELIRNYTSDYDKPAVLNNIVSCTGADTCRLGICLSKGLADAIYSRLENSALDLSYLDDARINITGCPNLCGQPLWTDLGFVGKVLHTDHAYPAYQVFVAANYTDSPALAESIGTIAAYKVPDFAVALISKFIEAAELEIDDTKVSQIANSMFISTMRSESILPDSPLTFNKWLRSKAGHKIAISLVEKYSEVPLFAVDKNYYFDWGSNDVFNVEKRGKPECSAGLFDMITVDQEAIKEAQTKYAKEGKGLYEVIFHASRMLLVTRGLDPQQPSEVFDAFIKEFIETELVSKDFLPLVEKAKTEGENGEYNQNQADALAASVNSLYAGMDDSLQFKKISAENLAEGKNNEVQAKIETKAESHKENPSSNIEITKSKDLRGVLCPMNFVRTKIELATLKSGDILEILLDDGKPIENVPGSVKLEGHEILSQTQHTDGYWQVIIKKK
ncbi:MAG: sulfurtransferase TusA family protein [Paludibacteraceae bacterium]|nr:sulfurtransferase TusA family protein [Paludibacteraceae bacterium]